MAAYLAELETGGARVEPLRGARAVRLTKGALVSQVHWPRGVELELSPSGDKLVLRGEDKAMFGTLRSLLRSAIAGLSSPYVGEVEVVGTGYSVRREGPRLAFSLGYSHPVYLDLPPEVSATTGGEKRLRLSSHDKRALGFWLARAESLKVPNPYTGNGVHILGKLYPRKKMRKA